MFGLANVTYEEDIRELYMSIHIGANKGDISDKVLLPGDPYRARIIAEKMLEDVKCYSVVRGMFGYTGYYNGHKISVQGTGMGLPSLSIYVNELIDSYGVKNLVRVGSCGSMQESIKLKDIILAMSSSTESNVNQRTFRNMDFAPTSDFELLLNAHTFAQEQKLKVHVGSILSADVFYGEDAEEWKLWARHGVLAVEMETSALYTIAARKKCRALSVLTVSDSFVTGETSTTLEREQTFTTMVKIALAALIQTN